MSEPTKDVNALAEEFAQRNFTLYLPPQDWFKAGYAAASEENTRLTSRIERLEGAMKEMRRRCEWYGPNGTEQERHHFVAVELVHEIDEALAPKAESNPRGTKP